MVTALVIVLLKVGEKALRNRWGKKKLERVTSRPAVQILGVFLTFHFICYSFSLIGLTREQLLPYHRLLGQLVTGGRP